MWRASRPHLWHQPKHSPLLTTRRLHLLFPCLECSSTRPSPPEVLLAFRALLKYSFFIKASVIYTLSETVKAEPLGQAGQITFKAHKQPEWRNMTNKMRSLHYQLGVGDAQKRLGMVPRGRSKFWFPKQHRQSSRSCMEHPSFSATVKGCPRLWTTSLKYLVAVLAAAKSPLCLLNLILQVSWQ